MRETLLRRLEAPEFNAKNNGTKRNRLDECRYIQARIAHCTGRVSSLSEILDKVDHCSEEYAKRVQRVLRSLVEEFEFARKKTDELFKLTQDTSKIKDLLSGYVSVAQRLADRVVTPMSELLKEKLPSDISGMIPKTDEEAKAEPSATAIATCGFGVVLFSITAAFCGYNTNKEYVADNMTWGFWALGALIGGYLSFLCGMKNFQLFMSARRKKGA